MRPIVVTNLVLLALAAILFVCDQMCDRHTLMGAHVCERDFDGRRLKDVLVGQPVIPDRIVIDLTSECLLLTYQTDRILWHKYPCVSLLCYGERVIDAEVK